MKSHKTTKTKTVQNKKLAADSVTLQKQKPKTNNHVPVLLHEVIETLSPYKGDTYLDLTAGYGGHASAILSATGTATDSVLIDRDMNAVQALRQKLPDAQVVHSSMSDYLNSCDRTFDLILADIGVSSPHLDESSRGFSYMHEGPLDMRMDQLQELTAADIVNSYDESVLADILYTYGEERASRKIARAIVNNRPFHTTTELALLIRKLLGTKNSKHPEARSFQALRIAVNKELDELQTLLHIAPRLLSHKGRLAIISFHSLEDRMIKRVFNELGTMTYDAQYHALTKKPIAPSKQELVSNPRARSAKLRVLQRK